MLKLFEYAIVLQPKIDKDGETVEPGEVLKRSEVLCKDEKHATLIAGREIPEDKMADLERITLVVRPF